MGVGHACLSGQWLCLSQFEKIIFSSLVKRFAASDDYSQKAINTVK